MNWQQPIPRAYTQLPPAEAIARIAARKAEFGPRLVILGHHYQQDDVIRFADVVGDSFQLSREAAKLTQAEYVIFCGVYFMAESADVLTGPHQKVLLPDLGAGCSMADMAALEDVQDAWEVIQEVHRDVPGFKLVPITYMNSSAAIKSFVGKHGGAVCTSSNCEKILRWALEGGEGSEGLRVLGSKGEAAATGAPDSSSHSAFSIHNSALTSPSKIIFFPDQHLGRNTAVKMGYPLESMVVWDYHHPGGRGGLTDAEIRNAQFILWKGHCSVHQLFRPEHVDQARQKWPGCTVIVQPECRYEVVQKADLSGSTDLIGKTIAAAPAGSKWVVGTEVHMVNRLAQTYPDKTIVMLSECQCLCTTMYRIDPPHLLWMLDELVAGRVVNQIKVDDDTAHWARVSLQRMLDITAGTRV
ncbi:MAG: quinolinate synthase [Phycisphaerae bacterium]